MGGAARGPAGVVYVRAGTRSADFPGWPRPVGGDHIFLLLTLSSDISSILSATPIPRPLIGPDPTDQYPPGRDLFLTSTGRAVLLQKFGTERYTGHLHHGFHLTAVDPAAGIAWERTILPPIERDYDFMAAAHAAGPGDRLRILWVIPPGLDQPGPGTPLLAQMEEIDTVTGATAFRAPVTGLDASRAPPHLMAAAPDGALLVAMAQLLRPRPVRVPVGIWLQKLDPVGPGYQAGAAQVSQRILIGATLHVDAGGRVFASGAPMQKAERNVTAGAAPPAYPRRWRNGLIIEQWTPDLLRPSRSIYLPQITAGWTCWGPDTSGGLLVSRNRSYSGRPIQSNFDAPLVNAIPQLPFGPTVGRILLDRDRKPDGQIRLSSQKVQFGSVPAGGRGRRSFTITNGDSRPAKVWVTPLEYEDGERVQPFRVLEGAGEHLLKPRGRLRVTVEFFRPAEPPGIGSGATFINGRWHGLVIVNSDNPRSMQELVVLRSQRLPER